VRQKHFIDSHKALTPLVVLALMAWYEQWQNVTAWVYLALHGTYGLLWLLKSHTFPDKQWEQPCPLWYGLLIWATLTLYWIAPWMITAWSLTAPPWLLGLCISAFAFGVFLHFSADMQKHQHLALQPGLMTTGLWSRTRNPNYLGELLIYMGFTALAMHWLPLLTLAVVVVGLWLPNMWRKDRSLSRYAEFADYKARSGLLFPRLL
jgi:protein-S-isoprenylcysteine O-methyltransferase Ste14